MGICNGGGGSSKALVRGVHAAVGASNEAALMWCRSNGFVEVEELEEDGLKSAQCGKEAKKEDDEERNSKEQEMQSEQTQEKRQGQDPKWMVKKL